MIDEPIDEVLVADPTLTTHEDLLGTSRLRAGGRRPKVAFDEVALMRRLEKEYDLGDWVTWQATESGASNDSWFVETTSGEVVVRRSHDLKTAASLRFEQALLAYLEGRGYPAPTVVPTRTGATSLLIDELHHMVTRRLPGVLCDVQVPAQYAAAAHAFGWFHDLVRDLPTTQSPLESSSLALISPTAQEHLERALSVAGPLLPTEQRDELRRDGEWLGQEMALAREELGGRLGELTYLITHGSWGPTAVLFEDGRLSGVVDFDRAAHDLLSLDLATALWVFCAPAESRRAVLGIDPGAVSTFLRAYARGGRVSEADLEALPVALRVRRLVKITKKTENLLTKATLAPHDVRQAEKFARILAAEAAQCRWLHHLPDPTGAVHGSP